MCPLDAVSPEAVRAQLGSAYDRFDAELQSRHVDLLRSVRRPEDVGLEISRVSSERWVVTVCTSDWVGALSVIAGLFTACGIEILDADLFTLRSLTRRDGTPLRKTPRRRPLRRRPSDPGQPTTKLLDVFDVRVGGGPVDSEFWTRFRQDLSTLMAALVRDGLDVVREQVVDRASAAVRQALDMGRLFPMEIELSNDASPTHTRLVVRSPDTSGFLFAYANALAMARVNIERAEIRTVQGEVRDTFWLTDRRGRKITDERRVHELRVGTALVKHFTHLLPRSPNPSQALRQFHALTQQMLSRPDWTSDLRDLESPDVLETLTDLLGVSQFLWEDFLRMQHENLFPVVSDVPALDERKSRESIQESVETRLGELREHGDQVDELNRFKDREMFRIDLRHITQRIGFRDFSEELTQLAEVVVGKAADLSGMEVKRRLGSRALQEGPYGPWCICALGKFGGRELGFGSDIELVFVYAGQDASGAPEMNERSRYFGEMVREFTHTVKAKQEGVFEIDLRLRPFGTAGALATSLSGFSGYYSRDGRARQFERLALVKLRPVAGDPDLGSRVAESRDAFVYSGSPVDVENILLLRRRQASELVSPGSFSSKYSPGGLADLEYFVQARQIAVGHLDADVRVTGTLDAIDRLAQGGHMSGNHAREISEAYQFLRRLIDALRAVRGNAKDLTIPKLDSQESEYLALRLGYQSSRQLHAAISDRTRTARAVWDLGVPCAR